jgi:hypothetical protein
VAYASYGHFYTLEMPDPIAPIPCRSRLFLVEEGSPAHKQIEENPTAPVPVDAIFIMMNPGGSQSLAEITQRVRFSDIGQMPIRLVSAIPDKTQDRIMAVMQQCQLSQAVVLNLSDEREQDSGKFEKSLTRLKRARAKATKALSKGIPSPTDTLEDFYAPSIFAPTRRAELRTVLAARQDGAPITVAWGCGTPLVPWIDLCLEALGDCGIPQPTAGVWQEGQKGVKTTNPENNHYYHPLCRRPCKIFGDAGEVAGDATEKATEKVEESIPWTAYITRQIQQSRGVGG